MNARHFFAAGMLATLTLLAGCSGGGSDCPAGTVPVSAGGGTTGSTPGSGFATQTCAVPTTGGTTGTGGTGGTTGTGGTGGVTASLTMGHFEGSTFVPRSIGIGQPAQSTGTVAGGSSTNLTVAIVDSRNTPVFANSATVQFGSVCASQGLAEITPLSRDLTSGGAVVRYTALGCAPSDTVFATATVNGVTVTANSTISTTPCSGSCTGGQVGLPGGTVRILTSDNQLQSSKDSEAEAITITVLVRDSGNVARAGIPVNISANSGTLILSAASVQTDNAGTVTAKLHTGGDPSLRPITITANVTGATAPATTTLNVVGTTMTVDGPTSATAGAQQTPLIYTFTLTNSAAEPISGQTITISENTVGAGAATIGPTDATGKATLSIATVNSTGGANRTLRATALSAQAPGSTAPVTPTAAVPNPFMVAIADAALVYLDSATTPVGPTPRPNAELGVQPSTTHTFRAQLTPSGTVNISGCDLLFSTTRGTFLPSGSTAVTVVPTLAGSVATGQIDLATGAVAGLATISVRAVQRPAATACPVTQITTLRTVEFVAVNPASVAVQASPTTVAVNGASSTIIATVRDATNNPVKNQLVNFTIEGYPDGSLSTPTALTGSDGRATVSFISGRSSSATNGVTVRARVGSTAINSIASLTVGGQAVRVNIGFGNRLLEPNETTYQLPTFISATDAAGNPASGAVVTLSNRATSYQKGHWVAGQDNWIPQYNVTGVQSLTDAQEPRFGCLNEDRDENGILDGRTGGNFNGNGNDDGAAAGTDGSTSIPPNTVLGEDINDNGQLDPDNPATIPTSVTLGADGTSQINITYPQSHGAWLQLRIRATTTVGGTEGRATSFVTLNITASDAELDQAPPGLLRSTNDLDGNGVVDTTGGTPVAVIGSPYGERSSCQITN